MSAPRLPDLLDRPALRSDHRLHYGGAESQFGDLWLPEHPHNGRRWPVVVFVHGGWWSSAFDLGYCSFLCSALRAAGVAVWSVEYRRTGITMGGWPATFQDVAAGFDYLQVLQKQFPLDLERVIAAGHSAGGHLAFWLAGRHHIPETSVLFQPQPRIGLRGVVSLAGAVDLSLLLELSTGPFALDREWVAHLMGGLPQAVPARYAAADPGRLLPLPCPQSLVQGSADEQIPPALPERWAARSRRQGSQCTVAILAGANHFDVVDPESRAWPASRAAILRML